MGKRNGMKGNLFLSNGVWVVQPGFGYCFKKRKCYCKSFTDWNEAIAYVFGLEA